jgi:4-coumarate--CoA ligase
MTANGFNAGDLVHAVERHGASFVVLTPAMVHPVADELKGRKGAADSVRTVQVGGDAVTRGVLERCTQLFPNARVVVNHGMTEGGGGFVWPFSRPRDIPFYGEMSPVGSVARGAAVRIRGANGTVARGELGELHVSCPSIIPGYLGGVSAESFHEGDGRRWFKTGDVGLMDKQGVVFILGRMKDMINGKVMPAPIESCLEKYTSVQVCFLSFFIFLPYSHLVRLRSEI